MRKEDREFAEEVTKLIVAFDNSVHTLPGIASGEALDSLVFQIVESVRRIRFVREVGERPLSALRKNPASEYFDPVRAAILYKQQGDVDEACWLIFLFVHFGKHLKSGYRLIADVYGKLGLGVWTWIEVVKDPIAFRHWLDKHQNQLRTIGNTHRGFGNHRKYQSLDAWKPNGTGEAVQSYVEWIQGAGNHAKLFDQNITAADGDPEKTFASLYKSMSAVVSFGRTAKFDYLTMIGKLGLAPICADSVYFGGATGPVSGAKLLFYGSPTKRIAIKSVEKIADSFATYLKIDKQVVEDSLCNWQKHPLQKVAFRG